MCRDHYPAWTRWPNWLACEVAIAACDLAEVLGSAVAINLLFPQIPLFWAVVLTAFDVLLVLALQGLGMRFIEALILTLVATIGGCYFVEIFVLPQTSPDFLEMGSALLTPGFRREGMVVGAIGIIGATVMPHNLYLHSALVRTRQLQPDGPAIRRAIKFNTIDTVAALSLAFFVNASILVLAATTFHGRELTLPDGKVVNLKQEAGEEPNQQSNQEGDKEAEEEPDWIPVAYLTLTPLLGAASASALFAVALLASGQSSTITGTLAGQVVMEGFMHWRMKPWARRLMTRAIAVVPAIFVIGVLGNGRVTDLLVLSQVVLALQLPLAMFPLLHFTSSRKWMGEYRNGWFLLTFGWASGLLITALDIYGLPETMGKAWRVLAG
jgi:manganese transport protein